MKVVADSSVLINLSAINQLELLRKRFSEVTIPQAVQEEVVIEGKGQPGSQEVQLEIPCGLATGFPYTPLLGRRGSG